MSNQIKAWKKWILNNNWLAGLAINLTVTLLGSVNNLLILIMVLCNLSTCPGYQIKFLEDNGLPTVNQLLTSLFPYATISLCNLASHKFLQDHVPIMNGIKLLVLDSQESQPTSLVLLASLLKISISFP